jgi:fatty-acyl-CoA synthase
LTRRTGKLSKDNDSMNTNGNYHATLAALMADHLARRPDAPAFIEDGLAISYSEFDLLCRQSAAWAAERGIQPGDRVAVWLVNRVEWLALWFALARAGAALVAVNTRYRAAELEYILQRSGARMLVLQLNFKKIDFPAVLLGVDAAAVPALERVAVFGAGLELPQTILGRPTTTFDPRVHAPVGPADQSDPDAACIMFTTSGTTKGPKLVIHSQRTVALHSQRIASAYGFDQPGAGLLGALPFCGVFGLNAVMGAFAAGAPVCVMETFDGARAAGLIRDHQLTHAFGSDEMYDRIFEHAPGARPFASARVFGFGAFHRSGEDFAVPLRRRGVPLSGLYGSSEVQALFSLQREGLPLAQMIEGGGLPASSPGAQVRVRDVDSGVLLPAGASGEIEIRADTNFLGYYNDPEATAEAVLPDGFFRTGDIGRLREDGSFVYETRRGDAMRLAGFLVNPVEIEDVIKRLPDVADAQVVAVEMNGQSRCVAFIIAVPGATPDPAAVIAWAGASMAPFKVPAGVWQVTEFPVTQGPNGVKIQRGKLREMALAALAQGKPT